MEGGRGTEGGRASSLFVVLCRRVVLVVPLSFGLVVVPSFHVVIVLSSSVLSRVIVAWAWDEGVVWSSCGLVWSWGGLAVVSSSGGGRVAWWCSGRVVVVWAGGGAVFAWSCPASKRRPKSSLTVWLPRR